MHAVGICGTDLHIWLGEYPSVPPVTMGHEVCGIVAEVGDGVDGCGSARGWRSRRSSRPAALCRTAAPGSSACASSGARSAPTSTAASRRGSVLPARNLHRVPDGLPDAAAALSEPLACVCNSLLDPSAVQPGDDVLVIGPGAIGLIAAQVARACGGAGDGARYRARRAPGWRWRAGSGSPDVRRGPREAPAADVVVECSGAGPGIADALRAARRRGPGRADGPARRRRDDPLRPDLLPRADA